MNTPQCYVMRTLPVLFKNTSFALVKTGQIFLPKRRCPPTKPHGVKFQNHSILTSCLANIIQPMHSLASRDQFQI
jgi:hypothetical protein